MAFPTVVVLSGGENSRFFPLSPDWSKATVPIAGQPLLLRTLANLAEAGAQRVIVVVPPRETETQAIRNLPEFKQLSLDVQFVVQPEAKGMGEAVLRCRQFLDETFAVISPYMITAGAMIKELMALKTPSAVCAAPTDTPWRYGMLTIKDGLATGIVEKPDRNSESSGKKTLSVYLLTPRFLELLEKVPAGHYSFETAADRLMKEEKVGVREFETAPPSLKYVWGLFDMQTAIFSELSSRTDPQAQIAPTAVIDDSNGPVVIEAGASIGHAARIVGPCYLGRGVRVGDFSLVRSSNLEAEVTVGTYTEVARSILLPRVHIHYGYLADSIIGPECTIGAGLITANKRLDRQSISVTIKGDRVETGRVRFGMLTGKHVTLGVRTTVMPGTCIGAQAVIYPGCTIANTIEPQAVVKN